MAPASEMVLRGDVAAAASSSFDELAAASASFDDAGANGAGGNGASGSGRPSSMVRLTLSSGRFAQADSMQPAHAVLAPFCLGMSKEAWCV